MARHQIVTTSAPPVAPPAPVIPLPSLSEDQLARLRAARAYPTRRGAEAQGARAAPPFTCIHVYWLPTTPARYVAIILLRVDQEWLRPHIEERGGFVL